MSILHINKLILVALLAIMLPGLLLGLLGVSYAVSTILVIVMSALIFLHSDRTWKIRTSNLTIMLLFFVGYVITLVYFQHTANLPVNISFFIFIFLVFCVLAASISRSQEVSHSEILMLGWTAVMILLINLFSNFKFYSEPSHLGAYVVPFACLVPYLSSKFKKTLHVFLLLILLFQFSITILVAWALTITLLGSANVRGIIAVILLVSTAISLVFYFDTRWAHHLSDLVYLLNASKASNLTVLVFIQGYEYIMYSLANFNIFGTGLDTLDQIALSSPAYSRLDAMGYPLNRSDGGLGLARISVELGSLITVILVIYIALLAYKIFKTRGNCPSLALAKTMFVVVIVNLFLRGGGIFDPSIVYLILISKLILKNEKKSNYYNISS